MRLARPLLLLLGTLSCIHAADSIEQQTPVRDFRLPFFNPDGTRSAFLQGEEARYLDASRFQINHLNFALFTPASGNRPETVLIAPEAQVLIHGKQPIVVGDKEVRLIRDDLEASGEGWRYDHAERHLSLSRNVRVVFAAEFKDLLK